MPRPLPKFRQGDALTARTMNDIVDRVNRQRILRGPGITLQETPDGTVVSASGGGGGPAATDLWCQLASSLGAATGTFPSSWAATTTTADVYQGSGTGLTKIATAAKIYNRYPVAVPAGKMTALTPAADGTGYAILEWSC